MRINCSKANVYFEDLNPGDVFYSDYESNYCMKIDRIQTEVGMIINSVVLSDGKPCSFTDDTIVEIVDGELML